ncbi:MAG TPA: EamA family transporter [Microbacteriaceae bacterium]|nr:EamA family transporter [Microbacteriaceae bacterium]
MLTVVVGLGSALIFGAADFLGGLAAKRLGAILTTGLAAAVGIGVFTLIGFVVPGRWSWEAVGYGALSGVFGAAAIGLLYACLAIGPMSILSPLTALVSAVTPLVVAVAYGDVIGMLGWIGLGVGLVAIVFVGFVPEKGAVRPSTRGILMAIGSGIAIGAFLIVMDLAPDDSGIVPMLANRTTNAAIMLTIAAVIAIVAGVRRSRAASLPSGDPSSPLRPLSEPSSPLRPLSEPQASRRGGALRTGIWLVVACGVVDAIANGGLLWGVRIGDLSVMAVLTALYPIGTIVLARVVLKERIAPIQYVGLVLAIAASALLALD